MLKEIGDMKAKVKQEREKLILAKERQRLFQLDKAEQERELRTKNKERELKEAELRALEEKVKELRAKEQGMREAKAKEEENKEDKKDSGSVPAEAKEANEDRREVQEGKEQEEAKDIDQQLMEEIEHDFEEDVPVLIDSSPTKEKSEGVVSPSESKEAESKGASEPEVIPPSPSPLRKTEGKQQSEVVIQRFPAPPRSPSKKDEDNDVGLDLDVGNSLSPRVEAKLKASKAAASASSHGACRTIVFVYDPTIPLSNADWSAPDEFTPFCSDSGDTEAAKKVEERRELAQELSESFGFYFSQRVCILALQKSADDQNTAARWLLDNGEDIRSHARAMLDRTLVLEAATNPSDASSPSSPSSPSSSFSSPPSHPALARLGLGGPKGSSPASNDISTRGALLLKATVFATHDQLIIQIPPNLKPWSTKPDQHTIRYYSLKDGSINTHSSSKITRKGPAACFDFKNNVIWTAALQSSTKSFFSYTNHGPAFVPLFRSATPAKTLFGTPIDATEKKEKEEKENTMDASEAKEREGKEASLSDSSPSTATPSVRPEVLLMDTALETLSDVSEVTSVVDVVVFVAAHIDRCLKHAQIAEAEPHPLLALRSKAKSQKALIAVLTDEVAIQQTQLALYSSPNSSSPTLARDSSRSRGRDRDAMLEEENRDRDRERELLMALGELIPQGGESALSGALSSALGGGLGLEAFGLGRNLASALEVSRRGGGAGSSNRSPGLFRNSAGHQAAQERQRLSETKTKLAEANEQLEKTEAKLKDIETRVFLSTFAPEEPTHPFCFELEDATFSSLKSLLSFCAQAKFVLPGQVTARELTYIGSVCLRLLKSHLQRYVSVFETELARPNTESEAKALTEQEEAKQGKSVKEEDEEEIKTAPCITEIKALRELLLLIALDGKLDVDVSVRELSCDCLMAGVALFYPSREQRIELFSSLMVEASSDPNRKRLFKGVVTWFNSQPHISSLLLPLNDTAGAGANGAKGEKLGFLPLLVQHCVDEFRTQLEEAPSTSAKDQGTSVAGADLPPSLRLLLVIAQDLITKAGLLQLNLQQPFAFSSSFPAKSPLLRASDQNNPSAKKPEEEVKLQEVDEGYLSMLLDFTRSVLKHCRDLLDECALLADRKSKTSTQASGSTSAAPETPAVKSPPSFTHEALLRGFKSSLLLLLPCLLTSLGSPVVLRSLKDVTSLLPLVTSFLHSLDTVNSSLSHARKEDIKFGCVLSSENLETHTFETPHPYPSGFRVLKQTVHIAGATSIAFTFDPRSCSTNGDDLLRFYADAAMTRPLAVGPLYGNPRDRNSNWPKKTLLVPGDTVTLCFSAKTPPKEESKGTRWGFKAVARGIVARNMPWLLDLESNVAALGGRMVTALLRGESQQKSSWVLQRWLSLPLLSNGLKQITARPEPVKGKQHKLPRPLGEGFDSSSDSPEISFIRQFVAGASEANLLLEQVAKHKVRFMSERLIKQLPAPLSALWQTTVRSVMAAMFKHEGILQDLFMAFSPPKTSPKGRNAAGSPTSNPMDALKLRVHSLLGERIKAIAISAQQMQTATLGQVQALREWNDWFGEEHMNVSLSSGNKREKQRNESILLDEDGKEFKSSDEDITDDDNDEEKEREFTENGPVEDGSKEYLYQFKFGQSQLRSAYEGQSGKVLSLCKLKGVLPKQRGGNKATGPITSSNIDMDESCHRLFLVLERERKQHQKQSRLYAHGDETAPKPFHLLSAEELKHQTYSHVLNQIVSLCDALLQFQASSRSLSSADQIKTPAGSDDESDSEDDDVGQLSLTRAQSEITSRAKSPRALIHPVIKQTTLAEGSDEDSDSGEEVGLSLNRTSSASTNYHRRKSPTSKPHAPPSLQLAEALPSVTKPSLIKTNSRRARVRFSEKSGLDNRVDDLRSWIDSYQRWKHWQKSEKSFRPVATAIGGKSENDRLGDPLTAIKTLVEHNVPPEELLAAARLHQRRAEQRETGLRSLKSLLKVVSFEVARVNLLGLLFSAVASSNSKIETQNVAESLTNRAAAPEIADFNEVSLFSGLQLANQSGKASVLDSYGALVPVLLDVLRRQFPSIELTNKNDAGLYLNSSSTILAINDLLCVPYHAQNFSFANQTLLFKVLVATLSVERHGHLGDAKKKALRKKLGLPEQEKDSKSSIASGKDEAKTPDSADKPADPLAVPAPSVVLDDKTGSDKKGDSSQVISISVSPAVEKQMLDVHWAATKLLVSQIAALDPAALPPMLTGVSGGDGAKSPYDVAKQVRELQMLMFETLSKELAACLSHAVFEAAYPAAGANRRAINSIEMLLGFLLLVCPAIDLTPAKPGPAPSTTTEPIVILSTLTLSLIHHHRSLTPKILRLALRLARKMWPRVDPLVLWKAFCEREVAFEASTGVLLSSRRHHERSGVSVIIDFTKELEALSKSENGGTIPAYLVRLIGSIMSQEAVVDPIGRANRAFGRNQNLTFIAESLAKEEKKKVQEAADKKSKERARLEVIKSGKEATQEEDNNEKGEKKETCTEEKKVVGSKGNTEEKKGALEKEEKEEKKEEKNEEKKEETEEKQKDAQQQKEDEKHAQLQAMLAQYPERGFCVQAHFSENFKTTKKWKELLSLPEFYSLIDGVRGMTPPDVTEVSQQAKLDFEERKKHRHGPSAMSISCRAGSVGASPDGKLTCTSGFSSVQANVRVTKGKWYYQAVLGTRGLLQIGWAKKGFRPHDGDGCGDDAHSWAYDGYRVKKWHGPPQNYGSVHWKAGDVVGCALDLDSTPNEMRFYLNGKDLGLAFSNFSVGDGLYPAASISRGETVALVFDFAKFVHPLGAGGAPLIPEGYHPLINDDVTLGDTALLSRASEIATEVEIKGSAVLIRGSHSFCNQMAASLALNGASVTVSPSVLVHSYRIAPKLTTHPNMMRFSSTHMASSVLPSLGLTDIDDDNDDDEEEKEAECVRELFQLTNGHVTHLMASELVAICRFLLNPSSSSQQWAESVSRCLKDTLLTSAFRKPLSPNEASKALDVKVSPGPTLSADSILGAACVLGGFSEPLRVGGFVRADTGDSNKPKGVVVKWRDGLPHARVVFTSDLVEQRTVPASGAATHRCGAGNLSPVAEFHVSLSHFPLSQEVFEALRDLILVKHQECKEAESKSQLEEEVVDAVSTQTAADRYTWVVSELKWRAVGVLESLLASTTRIGNSTPNSSTPTHARGSSKVGFKEQLEPQMLGAVGRLLLQHSADCPLSLQLEMVRTQADRLREKMWDFRNEVVSRMAATPLSKVASDTPVSNNTAGDNLHNIVCVYGTSGFREEPKQTAQNDEKMLKWWEKHIIPSIQAYVKGSFRPHEMEYFFAQLRQPLKQNDAAAAIGIAFTLCAQHVPEGVTFPHDGKDYSVLSIEEVRIGQRLIVTKSAQESDIFIASMLPTLEMAGRVKAVLPIHELVLLQFFDEAQGMVEEFWFSVDTLKLAPSLGAFDSALAHVEGLRNIRDVQASLQEQLRSLSHLTARRAILSLCSSLNSDSFFESQLSESPKEDDLDRIFQQFVLLAVSEGIDLATLAHLGEPKSPSDTPLLQALHSNVHRFLTKAAASQTPDVLCKMVLSQCRSLLETSSTFATALADSISFNSSPTDRSDCVKELRVESACGLVLLFAKDTRLSEGSTLSVFSDESCTCLVGTYSGGEGVILPPLTVPAGRCWIHVRRPKDIPARGKIVVIPIHPSLGLAFWVVHFILREGLGWAEHWVQGSTGQDGKAALCSSVLQMILDNYDLSSMMPSPLKESLLRLISKLLNKITECKIVKRQQVQDVSQAGVESQDQGLSNCLSQLKVLNKEMGSLYVSETEAGEGVFTSYLQQVVDLVVTAEHLRAPKDRMCTECKFLPDTAEARKQREEEEAARKAAEAAAVTDWSCEICTFLNPLSEGACGMCGSPKPRASTKPKKEKSSDGNGPNSDQMFHDVLALVSAMRVLTGDEVLRESTMPLAMLETAWIEAKADQVESRLFVLENVPAGPPDEIRKTLARAIRNVNPELRVKAQDIWLGIDPSKPPIPAQERIGLQKKKKELFTFKRPFDDAGILFHLGTKGKTQSWTNPADAGLCVITSSGLDSRSKPLKHLVDHPRRPSTNTVMAKAMKKNWIQFEFPEHTIVAQRYALRHVDGLKQDVLSGWLFEGSRDGKKWVTLKEHKREPAISSKGASWEIPLSTSSRKAFSFFRIVMTHPNASNTLNLVLGGFELYGKLQKNYVKGVSTPTNVFAVVELLNADQQQHKNLLEGLADLDLPVSLYPHDPSKWVIETKADSPAENKIVGEGKGATKPEVNTETVTVAEAKVTDSKEQKEEKEQKEREEKTERKEESTVSAPPEKKEEEKAAEEAQAEAKPEEAKPKAQPEAEPKEAKAEAGAKPDEAKAEAKSGEAKVEAKSEEAKADASEAKVLTKEEAKEARRQRKLERQRLKAERREARLLKGTDATARREEKRKRREAQRKAEEQWEEGRDERRVSLIVRPWAEVEATSAMRHAYVRSLLFFEIPMPIADPADAVVETKEAETKEETEEAQKEEGKKEAQQEEGKREGTEAKPSEVNAKTAESELETKAEVSSVVVDPPPSAVLSVTKEFRLAVQEICSRSRQKRLDVVGSASVLDDAGIAAVFGFGDFGVSQGASHAQWCQEQQGSFTDESVLAHVSQIAGASASGQTAVQAWLTAAGYDLNLEHSYHATFAEALASQSGELWPQSSDWPLMDFLQQMGERCGESNLINARPTQMRLTAEAATQYPALASTLWDGTSGLVLPALRLRYVMLRKFNTLFFSLVPLIDLRQTNDSFEGIAGLVRLCRVFVFPGVKSDLFEAVLDYTAVDAGKPPMVTLDRTALMRIKETGEGGTDYDFFKHSNLISTWQQFKDLDPSSLRPRRPAGTDSFLAFEVLFKGEQVVGEGGPYRQFFTDVGRELQEEESPLLIPCPNRSANMGESRDKFMINPSSSSSALIQLYEFLGLLFGVCIRTGVRFPLNLPAFVWKPLVGEALSRADLLNVDASVCQSLSFLEDSDPSLLPSLDERFVTNLSDGTTVELKEGGANVPVNEANRHEFVRLVLAARLTEHQPQIDALRRGMGRIVPLQLLNLLTWRDLEMAVCGRSTIDIQLLRRHTQYSDGLADDSPEVEMLWTLLEEFDQPTRRQFIRFAWAQERLPTDDASFIRSHTRLLIKPSPYQNADKALPRADTCFFNLELPAYSSKDIMRKRLLYAIMSCSSMNADNNVEDIHGRAAASPSSRSLRDEFLDDRFRF